jgi:glycosyltransferase involved in cell wall biosynthesis
MPASDKKPSVVFSVTNCICHDQRVQKMASVVTGLGCDVTIIGRRSGDCCDVNKLKLKTIRFRMIFRRGFLFYAFFNIHLFFSLLFGKYNLLVANDLDTLLPNYLVSKIRKIPLVYDSHEYFTGVPEIQNRPLVKWVWKTIEKSVFPHLKSVMTVSDSIADKYSEEYGIMPVTVRNCADSSEGIRSFTRDELGIGSDNLVVILQGTGINADRGGEELIEAISITDRVVLFVLGSGDQLPLLKSKVSELGITEKVRFIPTLPWNEMMKYTKSADAGISPDKDTNLNYRFSLPNKLFDYISAGIPVIAGSLTEVKKIIEKNDCGIIIPEITSQEISNALIKLRDDRHLLDKLKQNSDKASELLNWEKEKKIVIEFYSKILPSIKFL